MIVTKQKSKEDLLKLLDGAHKIFIIGCGDCAATCKTGGEEEVKVAADFLKRKGKEITGTVVPDTTCVAAQAKIAFAKNKKALSASDAILVLACGSGVQCVKEYDRHKLKVLPGCDTLFAAVIDKDSSFVQVCSSCGACILDLTEGICPVTRCPKSILNGPCGGQEKGKCEVDKDKDCVWILIYKRLKEKGRLEELKRRIPAKDYRQSGHPASLTL